MLEIIETPDFKERFDPHDRQVPHFQPAVVVLDPSLSELNPEFLANPEKARNPPTID